MNSKYYSSATPLIQALGWPTISNLIQIEAAAMYNSVNKLALEYMQSLFTRCSERYGHVLHSTDTNLKLPLLETCAG